MAEPVEENVVNTEAEVIAKKVRRHAKRRQLTLKAPRTHPEPFVASVPTATFVKYEIIDEVCFYEFSLDVGPSAKTCLSIKHRYSVLSSIAEDFAAWLLEEPPLVELPFIPLPGIPGPLIRTAPPFPGKFMFNFTKNSEPKLLSRSQGLQEWLNNVLTLHEFLLEAHGFTARLLEGVEDDSIQEEWLARLDAMAVEVKEIRRLEGVEHNAVCLAMAREKGLLPDEMPAFIALHVENS